MVATHEAEPIGGGGRDVGLGYLPAGRPGPGRGRGAPARGTDPSQTQRRGRCRRACRRTRADPRAGPARCGAHQQGPQRQPPRRRLDGGIERSGEHRQRVDVVAESGLRRPAPAPDRRATHRPDRRAVGRGLVGGEGESGVQDQDRLTGGGGERTGHCGGRRATAPPGTTVPGVVHPGGGVARRQRQQLDLGHGASRRVVRIGHGSRHPRPAVARRARPTSSS